MYVPLVLFYQRSLANYTINTKMNAPRCVVLLVFLYLLPSLVLCPFYLYYLTDNYPSALLINTTGRYIL